MKRKKIDNPDIELIVAACAVIASIVAVVSTDDTAITLVSTIILSVTISYVAIMRQLRNKGVIE